VITSNLFYVSGISCLELVLLTENVTGENDEVISFNNIDGERFYQIKFVHLIVLNFNSQILLAG